MMELNDGDIIFATCHNIPLCYHVGIVVFEDGIPIVYNNTPGATNEFGGNIVAQTVDVFMSKREFIKTVPAPNCSDLVREYSYSKRFEKWSALYYNCEDYVNEIKYSQKRSELRQTWQTALIVGLFVFMTNKK